MKTLSIAMSLGILAGVGALTFQTTPSEGRMVEILEDDGAYPPIQRAEQREENSASGVVRVGIAPDVAGRMRDAARLESPRVVLIGRRVFNAADEYIGRVSDIEQDAAGRARVIMVQNADGETGAIPAARATYDARHNVVIFDVAIDPFSS